MDAYQFRSCRKTNVIRHRVADFLRSHAPFDALALDDLLSLAGSGRVKFHESEEDVFEAGQTVAPFLWVIQQGRVELWEGIHRRDVLGAGDLLGLKGLASLLSLTPSSASPPRPSTSLPRHTSSPKPIASPSITKPSPAAPASTRHGRYDSRLLKTAFGSIQRLLELTSETFAGRS